MFFCPNCNHTYDITKHSVQSQKGGKSVDSDTVETVDTEEMTGGANWVDELVNKAINHEEIDPASMSNLDLNLLPKNPSYKKLNKKSKEYVYNKLLELLPNDKKLKGQDNKGTDGQTNVAFFKCNNCGDQKPVADGQLIFSRSYVRDDNETGDINIDLVNDPVLLRTRRYECRNKSCPSHKDLSKREAVMGRIGDSYKMFYICVACETRQ